MDTSSLADALRNRTMSADASGGVNQGLAPLGQGSYMPQAHQAVQSFAATPMGNAMGAGGGNLLAQGRPYQGMGPQQGIMPPQMQQGMGQGMRPPMPQMPPQQGMGQGMRPMGAPTPAITPQVQGGAPTMQGGAPVTMNSGMGAPLVR